MTLDDYIKSEKEDLDKFAIVWQEMQTNNIAWPRDMEPAEWDEQFIIFAEEKLND